jgi:hypothetical protein
MFLTQGQFIYSHPVEKGCQEKFPLLMKLASNLYWTQWMLEPVGLANCLFHSTSPMTIICVPFVFVW